MGDGSGNYDNFQDDEPWYMWIGHIVVSALTFWLQAAVTEDRFVPALNVIATWLELPDDVAGATLMAGGASTPELFGSYIALFVTHSALGIGTIVGSGIFNQLIICAGAVLAAKGDELQLDPLILMREAGFYALAIAILLFALSKKEHPDDDVYEEAHIIITAFEGGLLISGYVLYVLVCANFEKVCAFFKKSAELADGVCHPNRKLSKIAALTKIDVPELPFLRHIHHEPSINFQDTPEPTGSDIRNSSNEEGDEFCTYELEQSKPDDVDGLKQLVKDEVDGKVSCFLWQQSFFYNKIRIDVNAWQLRWFTFTSDGITSMSDKDSGASHSRKYPSICKVEVDESHLLIKLHRTKTHKKPYILMAPNTHVLEEVVIACDQILKSAPAPALMEPETDKVSKKSSKDSDEELIPELLNREVNDEHHHSMIAFPHNAPGWKKALFYPLFPFNAAIQLTVPDVRSGHEEGKFPLAKAFAAIVASISWLIISSFILVESLEELGRLMNIPHAIIGITISAAGTSVANFVASQCAAKQGLGNMAVSNAFGSNSFIIFMGLGLPWFTFCITEQAGQPYYKLRDEGLTDSVIMMAAVLVVFMAVLYKNNWILYKKHAKVLIAGYILYVFIAIAQVYL